MGSETEKQAVISDNPVLDASSDTADFFDALSETAQPKDTSGLSSSQLVDSDSDVMCANDDAGSLSNETSTSSMFDSALRDLCTVDEITEFANLTASTLSSSFDGATIQKLVSHIGLDWDLDAEAYSKDLGFASFSDFLVSDVAKKFIEMVKAEGSDVFYGVVPVEENEHILQRVRDSCLSDEARQEKRKRQRLMELKKPENEKLFIEGKRRIIEILKDLKGDENPISYQVLRDEYERRHGVSLNDKEHSRLFKNKAALKNFQRAFAKEVVVIGRNPLQVKLVSKDITVADVVTEEERLRVANMHSIDLSDLNMERAQQNNFTAAQSSSSYVPSKDRAENASKPKVGERVNAENDMLKPTMSWGDESSSDSSGETVAAGTSTTTSNDNNKKSVRRASSLGSRSSDKKYTRTQGGRYTEDEDSEEGSDDAVERTLSKRASRKTKQGPISILTQENAQRRSQNDRSMPAERRSYHLSHRSSSRKGSTAMRSLYNSVGHSNVDVPVSNAAEFRTAPASRAASGPRTALTSPNKYSVNELSLRSDRFRMPQSVLQTLTSQHRELLSKSAGFAPNSAVSAPAPGRQANGDAVYPSRSEDDHHRLEGPARPRNLIGQSSNSAFKPVNRMHQGYETDCPTSSVRRNGYDGSTSSFQRMRRNYDSDVPYQRPREYNQLSQAFHRNPDSGYQTDDFLRRNNGQSTIGQDFQNVTTRGHLTATRSHSTVPVMQRAWRPQPARSCNPVMPQDNYNAPSGGKPMNAGDAVDRERYPPYYFMRSPGARSVCSENVVDHQARDRQEYMDNTYGRDNRNYAQSEYSYGERNRASTSNYGNPYENSGHSELPYMSNATSTPMPYANLYYSDNGRQNIPLPRNHNMSVNDTMPPVLDDRYRNYASSYDGYNRAGPPPMQGAQFNEEPRRQLANVVKTIVQHSNGGILLVSDLSNVVRGVYGLSFDPERDPGHAISYGSLIREYCCDVMEVRELGAGRLLAVWHGPNAYTG